MNASQSKSCREPVRGEMRELGGADVVAASLEGRIAIVRAGSARAGRQPDVLGALEVSSFAFMHSNQQRCERSDDFRDGWPKLPCHPFVVVWYAQSCCGLLGSTTGGDVKPTEPPKSLATTPLEHVEACHGGVFTCSKSAMEVVSVKEQQRFVSW